jgi:tetratricopeptide (TPR) repeat protein
MTQTHQPGKGVAGWSTFLSPLDMSRGTVSLDAGNVLAGRYKIIRSLGEGGMGAVYKAHDLEVDRLVAIKVIRPELACDPQILQRFKQELILARQVTHRNVVRIFDLGVAENLKFISMEFIEGRELASLLEDSGKLPPKQAADIMLQVCRGLEVAHAEGVIHRDLKPQNIMIDAQGRAAVMDFGIAYSIGTAAVTPTMETVSTQVPGGLTMVGALIGTPRYMSPEQARCEPVSARSDIFTVGLILYELLTGITPFRGKTGKETLRKRIEETAKPPIELDPRIPKALNQMVMKCLERDPAKRYASAGELVHDLEGFLGIGSAGRAKQARRMKWLAGGMATLLAGAGGFIFWNHMNALADKPHALVKLVVSDFANRTGDPHLNGTLEPMFQVALERASFVTSYNRGSARKIGAELQPGMKQLDEPLARLVALREGLGVVVSGAIEKRGNRLHLTAKAVNTGKWDTILEKDITMSDTRELPDAVEKLSGRIRRALGDASSTSKAEAAETFSAASLEAAQLYSQAQDLQWSGKWEDSIAAYKKAIQIDPNLSRAYSGLAATLMNMGRRQEAEPYYQLALAHVSTMSEREKYRTRGSYFLATRDYRKAAEQFQALVSQFPADTAGIANLALAYFYERNMPLALKEGQRAIDIYPKNLLQRNNVGLYAMYAGDFDRAIKESDDILEINPAFDKAYLCLAIAEAAKGDLTKSEEAYKKMATLSNFGASEAALGLADLAIYQGLLQDASNILEKGIQKDLERNDTAGASKKSIVLAAVQLDREQRGPALLTAEKAASANDDDSILFPAAEIFIEAGETAKASGIAAKLSARFEPEPRAEARIIEGEILLKASKIREAIDSFREAQKLADTWLGRYAMGRAYLAAGMYPDADGEFDICMKRRGEATAVFLDDDPSLRYLPALFYYQGRAREGLKSPGAAESYKAFLAIKRGAENDPLVADAKKRLK